MRQSIAQLCQWAIVVVNARNTLATGGDVVWIPVEFTRWTLTFGNMIVGYTDRAWTASDVFTSRSALQQVRRFDALTLFIFSTFNT